MTFIQENIIQFLLMITSIYSLIEIYGMKQSEEKLEKQGINLVKGKYLAAFLLALIIMELGLIVITKTHELNGLEKFYCIIIILANLTIIEKIRSIKRSIKKLEASMIKAQKKNSA